MAGHLQVSRILAVARTEVPLLVSDPGFPLHLARVSPLSEEVLVRGVCCVEGEDVLAAFQRSGVWGGQSEDGMARCLAEVFGEAASEECADAGVGEVVEGLRPLSPQRRALLGRSWLRRSLECVSELPRRALLAPSPSRV